MRYDQKKYTYDDDVDLSIEGYSPDYDDEASRYQPAIDDVPEPEPYRPAPTSTTSSTHSTTPLRKAAEKRPREQRAAEQKPQQPPQPQQRATKAPEQKPKPQPARQPKVDKPLTPSSNRTPKPDSPDGEKVPMRIVAFFTDYRTRLFLAITLALISLFVVIALFSHFNVGGADQSVVSSLSLGEMASKQGVIDNTAGGFGALISKALLCDSLGLGSIVLIIYLWILILALTGARKCSFIDTTLRCMLLAITISTVLGLITYNAATEIYWGGLQGHYINKFLIENATMIGAVLVSVFLVATVCCVYLNELRKMWLVGRQIMADRQEKARLEREMKRQQDEHLEEDEEEDEIIDDQTGFAIDDQRDVTPAPTNHPQNRPEPSPAHPVQSVADQPSSKDEEIVIDDAPDTDPVIIIDGQTVDPEFIIKSNTSEEGDPTQTPSGSLDTPYDHRADLSRYRFPDIDLLEDRPSGPNIDLEEQQANKERIKQTLLDYKIPISRIEATVGPTVTLYEIVPAEGVRISQIKRLEDDIALSLAALGIRIIAPIPGKGTVGIEVPNNDPQTVSMRSVLGSRKYQECKMALPMAMGATISNDIFIADLAKMPHLLVAGATGMGKSVGLNAIIASLLYKKHPTELKFVLIDPKMVEFSLYSKLERHYLAKLENEQDAIITDMKKVVETLNSLCVEMDNRYELLRNANVRSLEEYNRKFTERRLNPEKGHKYLPYIVVVVDEFADLLMTQGKEVETPIARIAQKARAVGIHMILATQRPSTNVITGLIKANFPGRIAFRVIQMVDSRTILDCPGANQLIGRGDMLFSHNGSMERVQCAFISTEEVERLTEFIDSQYGFPHAYYLPEYVPEEIEGGLIGAGTFDRDALFEEAARFVVTRSLGSTSSLQRQFGIGYNRAGKLMDQLEAAGIVGPVNGSKPRNILVDIPTLERILEQA